MTDIVRSEIAHTGTLRAGINLANALLVTGKSPSGSPIGVAPDMAAEIARRLDVPVDYVPFDSPGALADAAVSGTWDIGLIGAEPERAEKIAFTAPYVEIEATFAVPAGSAITEIDAVDRPGNRIAVMGRAAYGLALNRSLRHADLIPFESQDAARGGFVEQGLDALAALRPRLVADAARLAGATILPGRFTAVQQAIGTPKGNTRAFEFLQAFVTDAKRSGFVQELINRHKVDGLTVAP